MQQDGPIGCSPARTNSRPCRKQNPPRTCWIDWHTERLTPHDGLIRRNHPVVVGALQRQQSATSLVKLLRDPLGYLWQYGFGWNEPSETEDPLLLDALAFGNLVHAALQTAVSRLEVSGGFSSATVRAIETALDSALETVATDWEQSQPTPPPVIWRRKLQDIRNLALVALTFSEPPLPSQRSWAEISVRRRSPRPRPYTRGPRKTSLGPDGSRRHSGHQSAHRRQY